MVRTLHLLALAAALAWGAPARATASFANRELGLGLGAATLLPAGGVTPTLVLPLTLEGGLYLESGFALYLQLMAALALQPVAPSTLFATGGRFGLQYLFLEESVRPYLLVELAALYLSRPQGPNFLTGPGAGFGVDLFVSESIAVGASVRADALFTVDASSQLEVRVSVGGGLHVHTYF